MHVVIKMEGKWGRHFGEKILGKSLVKFALVLLSVVWHRQLDIDS